MKYFLLAILVVSFSNHSHAQERFRFHSSLYGGVVHGESETALQVLTINGFQKKTWFGGIGAGLDEYIFHSLPLFLHAEKYFLQQQQLFLNASGGINFSKQKDEFFIGRSDIKEVPAPFYELGAGYLISLGSDSKTKLSVNGGYSFKHVRQKIPSPGGANPFGGSDHDRYDYRYHRLFIRLGFRF